MVRRASDGLIAFCLCLITILLYSYHLGALEFFRHTEADRTLIAWEMVETGNFLVPHLLHSEILTKPPLFYWILASFISLFGEASEWVVRFPSVIMAGLFAGFQFLFLRALRFEKSWALVGSAVLATAAGIQEYSRLAEIDMLFGFLSGLVFGLGFLAIERRSFPLTVTTFLVLAASFLAKGPPSLAFYGIGLFVFFVWSWRKPEESRLPRSAIKKLLNYHLFAFIVGSLPVIIWAALLATHVGWDTLGQQVRVEIFERIVEKSSHAHGPFFYFQALLLTLIPWTVFLLAALWRWKFPHPEDRRVDFSPDLKRFLVWNLGIVLPAFILLSLASGKSNRYLFPVFGPLCNLVLLSLMSIYETRIERRLFSLGKYFGLLAGLVGVILPIFLKIPGVSQSTIWLVGIFFSAVGIGLTAFLRLNMRNDAFVGVCLLMCVAQAVRTEILTPAQNAKRSVKEIAEGVNGLIPPGERVYTVELFDRWVNYYLKRMGRESYRLSPAVADELRHTTGRKYLLLDTEEESWRYQKLKSFDPSARLVKDFSDPRDRIFLVEAAGDQLYKLKPHPFFPTIPSLPYD